MKAYSIVIPEDKFDVVSYRNKGLPAIAILNTPVMDFNPKEVFPYFLAVTVKYQPSGNGMPAASELKKIEAFEDEINPKLKDDPSHPNVLFLGRITWNGARDLFYRVYDADKAHEYLQTLIKQEDYPVYFDYLMQEDKKWKAAKFLDKLRKSKS